MKFKVWEWALIAALVLTVMGGVTVGAQAQELSGKMIRLHVVANSDTQADQQLKLKVRDAVLEELRVALKGAGGQKEAGEIIGGELRSLEKTASGVIREAGENYAVRATLCREDFPTTQYDNFALPAGEYMSLRVTIGKGEGHNWWCVVFPPICDAGVIDREASAAIGLTEEDVKLITGDSGGYVVKFRLMELWGKFLGLFN